VVEGPQVFQRAAAAADNDDVHAAQRVELADTLRDLAGGALALHARGRQHDVDLAEASADHAEHVADGGAARRRDDSDLAREARRRPLARGIEYPPRAQTLLELLEGELQGAPAFRLEELDPQRVAPALGVDLERAEGQHVQAVARLEPHPPRARP